MWIIWLSIFVLALIIESLSPELVSMWFALGGIIALIISFIPGVAWWISIVVFVVVSATAIFTLRPILVKFMKRNEVSSNVDDLIHKKGLITKEASPTDHGEVKINGVIWTAVPEDENETINQGTSVEVIRIEGNKLIVRKNK